MIVRQSSVQVDGSDWPRARSGSGSGSGLDPLQQRRPMGHAALNGAARGRWRGRPNDGDPKRHYWPRDSIPQSCRWCMRARDRGSVHAARSAGPLACIISIRIFPRIGATRIGAMVFSSRPVPALLELTPLRC